MTHRIANVERKTKETEVTLSVDLDGTGKTDVRTDGPERIQRPDDFQSLPASRP